MALQKVDYVNQVTVITAENMNDIQDAIIDLEQSGTITVDSALSSTSENPVQNKVINQALGAKAPLASPTFTGTPKAPTAASGTNNTQLATTAFVQQEIAAAAEVFWATYNTTTEAEITAAVTAGKTVLCKISDEIFYLVSKAAIGPSGSAWIFASANQTSMRVTFVSGSYWNSIGTLTIPTKTSDLTNDSGFVNASGAAAAAPVQSVNGQTGAVTVPSLPTGGTAGQILKLIPGFPIGTDPLPAWSDPENQAIILDFTLDATDFVTSGPIWSDIDTALNGTNAVVAHVTKNDGTELFAPLVYYDDTPGAWTAKFSATNGYDGLTYIIASDTGVANTWVYSEWDINADLTDLYDSKLDNNLGTSEAGKFLVVGSDGAVTTMTLATWQGGNY